MPQYKGIIFDFNGVLWWDTQLQEDSWIEFARRLRGTPFSKAEMDAHMHGRPNRYVQEYLTGRTLEPAEVADLIQQKEGIYRDMCLEVRDDFRLSPGAIDLLDFLVVQAIPHTIATASERTNVDFFIKHLHLERWFDLEKIVYDDGTYPGKPAPDIYRKAAQRIGVAPEDCIVVEDAQSGIEAAHAAGIGKVIALSTSRPAEELANLPGVNAVLPSLRAIETDWFAV